jgi:dihydrofolate synthase/folylpolyglutamate synthase
LVGRDWTWQTVSSSAQGQQIQVWDPSATAQSQPPPVYSLSLLGQHQQENAVTALATIAQLKFMGQDVPDSALSAGLRNTQWPGRLEVLDRSPWVILDGAHNGHSMHRLRVALEELFPHRNAILILGVSADKDLNGILNAILPVARHVLLTQSHHPRAATAESLAEWITARVNQDNKHPTDLQQIVPIDQALDAAQALAGKDDLICITGSLFVVAELRAAWLKRTGKPVPSD